jgi:hypothetical protein
MISEVDNLVYLIVKQSLMITYLLSIVKIRAGIPTTTSLGI